MKITTEKIDLFAEKHFIIGLATNETFCEHFLDTDLTLLTQIHLRHIAKVCINHYQKYGKPIGKNLYNIVMSRFRRTGKEQDLDKVEAIIQELSEQAIEKEDTKFEIDQAYQYLNFRFNQTMQEKLKHTEESAEELIASAKAPTPRTSEITSWSDDPKALRNLLQDDTGGEFLFEFPGKFGEVVGKIRRQDLVCFAGYYKSGKTHTLIHTAQTALVEGLNVLFVSLEMSAKEIAERMTAWVTHQPIDGTEEVDRPKFERDSNGTARIVTKHLTRNAFSRKEDDLRTKAIVGYSRLNSTRGKSGLVAEPRGTISANDLKKICLQFRAKTGVKPDVVVLDYADLMRKENKTDYRQSLGEIWEGLRSLAQQENMAIITASQLNDSTRKADVSDDRRKYAIVTAMIKLFRDEGWLEKNALGVKQEMIRHSKPNKKELIVLHNYAFGEVITDEEYLINVPELQSKGDQQKKKVHDIRIENPDAKVGDDGTFYGAKSGGYKKKPPSPKIEYEICPNGYIPMNGTYFECKICSNRARCKRNE